MIRDAIVRTVDVLDRFNLYPAISTVEGCGDVAEVEIDGKIFVNFATNSYLGISCHPKIIEASCAAARKYGGGSGGSRLTAGTMRIHRQLEERVAEFKGAEDAVVFSAGYLVNAGMLPALICNHLKNLVVEFDPTSAEIFPPVDVFLDELVHASIIDGLAIASFRLFGQKARFHFFRHLDMDDLARQLKASSSMSKLVVTDGVFSLHGHLAPLDILTKIAHQNNACVYVDDAHGTGVFGATGRGTAELFGVDEEIDFPIGTFSKALGGAGGFVTGDKTLCRFLRVACRTQMFQTSMPPITAAGLIAAFDVVESEPERRALLLANAQYLRDELRQLGFDILGSNTQIIPVRFWNEQKAKIASEMLSEAGIFAPCYYYPAVRRDEAMLRLNVTAEHTKDQLDRLLISLEKAGVSTGVLWRNALA